MTELIIEPTSTAQWQRIVREAANGVSCELDEHLESYLVFLLMRFSRQSALSDKVMALEYLKGLTAHGEIRNTQLRDVGDQCLLLAGVFPQIAQRRRVRISYFIDLGRSAYNQLSQFLNQSAALLYQDLSHTFVKLTEVLHCMRELDGSRSLSPIEALELWQDTGSKLALSSLRERTKATPAVKNPKSGIH